MRFYCLQCGYTLLITNNTSKGTSRVEAKWLYINRQTCESAFSAPNTAYHHISGLQNHKVTEQESWLWEMVPSNTPKVNEEGPIQSPKKWYWPLKNMHNKHTMSPSTIGLWTLNRLHVQASNYMHETIYFDILIIKMTTTVQIKWNNLKKTTHHIASSTFVLLLSLDFKVVFSTTTLTVRVF